MSQPDEDDDVQIVQRDSSKRDDLMEKPGDPPVVARMVIEIRSDGSRTVARGALEEVVSGEKVAIEAHGTTPMALAANLTKSLLSAPLMAGGLRDAVKDTAKRAVKRLLRRDKPEDD